MITAPFNFVPLSEKVFFPDWAEQVSHDVPFEDAQSGVLDISITAKSPIFIRDHEKPEQFCQYNGQYYIPSSSVKGMVRNVLEILSFSKMTQVNNDTYAVRDLRNRELYMSKMIPDNTFCGFLKQTVDGYVIENCGKPGRVRHEEIDKIYNINFASKFKQGKFQNKAKDKTAKVKYEMIASEEFIHGFEYLKKDVNREIYRYAKNSTKKGTLVLTGQPSARKEPKGQKPSGKIYEFVFFDTQEEIKVSQEVYDNFLFAYFDQRTTEPKESADWTFWKKRLENGGKVPIFFQRNGKEIVHFGLSYLYKLPYSNAIKDGIPASHKETRRDLAETIFGYVDKQDALKGRVQFSHFKAQNAKTLEKRTEILGTPRASYYPIYVKQNGIDFKTFMDSDFSLSGWKRYPIHKGSAVQKTEDTGNEKVGTTFSPLDEGTVFKGKVRFHNLTKAELGALISSLTFHNTHGCYHNIGMAKPLGYGKVELKLSNRDNLEDCLKAFETEITEQIENWSESEQVVELLSMATEQENSGNSVLNYMPLKAFADHKSKEKDYLRNYTKLTNIKRIVPKTLITLEDLEALRTRQEERQEKEKILMKEREAKLKHDQEWEIVYTSTNIATIEGFIKKYPDSKYLNTAHEILVSLENNVKQLEEEKATKEAKTKWEAVQKVDKKYYQKALEDFIVNYGDSIYLKDAQQELDRLNNLGKQGSKENKGDFSSVVDGKSLEKVMKTIPNPSEEEKKLLEEAMHRVYPHLNRKKKKQLIRIKLLNKWLGAERLQQIIELLDRN